MTAKTRIYIVETHDGTPHLVRAVSKAQALHHIASSTMTASVATQDRLIWAVGKGIVVETASERTAEAAQ